MLFAIMADSWLVDLFLGSGCVILAILAAFTLKELFLRSRK
jgi:hypothetical protein